MTTANSEYTVVARRYRPQQFDELIGQEAPARALKNAIIGGRVAHAYLFTGARGVGKTSAARILAKALNCEKGASPNPCDACSSCRAIAGGDDIDVREIDGASNRGIEDIRAIRQDVSTRPTRSRYKIYIIDEVHMLSKDAFNALLKTLEEPPPHVKFLFATTEIQKVPITILSRCQRFDFGNISTERIAAQLRSIVSAEKMDADDDALEIIARRAAGSMRDGQSLLDQLLAFGGDRLQAETVQHLLGVAAPERIVALAEAIVARDPKLTLDRFDSFVTDGVPVGELLDQLIDHWRDLMLVSTVGREAKNLATPTRYRAALEQQATASPLDTILAGLDVLLAAKGRQRGGSHSHTMVQMALVRLCRLDDLTPLSQLAMWLQQGNTAPMVARAMPGSGLPLNAPLRALTLPPEAKKKSTVEPTVAQSNLTPENMPAIWPEVLAQVGGILGREFQKAGLPAIAGPKSLVLTFALEYNAASEYCAIAANIQKIEQTLKAHTGREWSVRVERAAAPQESNGHAPRNGHVPPISRVRPQEAMQQFPILQRVIELFDALPVFLDPGFGSGPVEKLVVPAVSDDTAEES